MGRINYSFGILLILLISFGCSHSSLNRSPLLPVDGSDIHTEESSGKNLSPNQQGKVEDEIADILIYAIRIAQVLNIDLLGCVARKIEKNELKYPAAAVRGKAGL